MQFLIQSCVFMSGLTQLTVGHQFGAPNKNRETETMCVQCSFRGAVTRYRWLTWPRLTFAFACALWSHQTPLVQFGKHFTGIPLQEVVITLFRPGWQNAVAAKASALKGGGSWCNIWFMQAWVFFCFNKDNGWNKVVVPFAGLVFVETWGNSSPPPFFGGGQGFWETYSLENHRFFFFRKTWWWVCSGPFSNFFVPKWGQWGPQWFFFFPWKWGQWGPQCVFLFFPLKMGPVRTPSFFFFFGPKNGATQPPKAFFYNFFLIPPEPKKPTPKAAIRNLLVRTYPLKKTK